MNEYVYVGTIIGTHALKGEVKIYSVTDFKEDRYKKGNTLFIETKDGMVEVVIKNYREHKGKVLLLFEGYENINDVLQFNKCKLYVHDSQIEELEDEDEFYYRDLIGCKVVANNDEIGQVKDVVNYGASDILVLKTDQDKEIMIPFVNEFVEEINVDEQVIYINPIEGLLGD